MKNSILMLVLGLGALAGACYTFVRKGEQKNLAAEIAARKTEAARDKAQAAAKAAESEARKATQEAAAAKKKAEAARDDKAAAEARAQAATAERKAAEDAKIAAADAAKRAVAEQKKAEAEARAAEARRAQAEAERAVVEATNAVRQAELEIALNQRLQTQAAARLKKAEIEAETLKKQELDRQLAEVNQLQEVLRQREEASRPERTIKDIMTENERRRAEEEAAAAEAEERRLAELREKDFAAYEAEMARRRKINREGVAGPAAKELTPAEKILKSAEAGVARAQDAQSADTRRRILAELEPELKRAIREGRKLEAEEILAGILALVPDYTFTSAKE